MAKAVLDSAPLVILTVDEIHRACVRHVLMQKIVAGEANIEDLDVFMTENHIQSRVSFREHRGMMYASVAIDKITLKQPKAATPKSTSSPEKSEP